VVAKAPHFVNARASSSR